MLAFVASTCAIPAAIAANPHCPGGKCKTTGSGNIGDSYCLRKSVHVREIKKVWDTYGLVKLDPQVDVTSCTIQPVISADDPMFVQTIAGETRFYLYRSLDKKWVDLKLSPGISVKGKPLWLSATDSDYDYYVYMYDDNPMKSPIDKIYRVEVFPGNGGGTPACNDERPSVVVGGKDKNLDLVDASGKCPGDLLQEVNSGHGGEPGHP
jgi:hypothetical protein